MSKARVSDKYGPKTKYLMLVFVCLFVFLVNGFGATTFNLLQTIVATDLGWSAAERGVVATAYSTGMIWFAFFSGIAADKVNVKRLWGVLLLAIAVFIFLRAFVVTVTLYYIIMFICGALVALIIPVYTKIIPLWFTHKQLAVANGIMSSANPLGQFTANFFSLPLIALMGGRWQNIYIVLGIVLVVLGALIFIFGKNRISLDAEASTDHVKSEADLGIWKNIKEVIKVPQLWLYMLASAIVLGIVYGGGSQIYVVLVMDQKWALDVTQPGNIMAMNNIGSMIMYTVFPILIGKFFAKNYDRNYRLIAIICGVIAAVLSFAMMRSYSMTIAMVLYFLCGMVFGQMIPGPKVLMMRLPQVSGPRAGTALGLYTTIERISQTVFVSIFAAVMATQTVNQADTLSWLFLLYLISPLFIGIAWILDNKQKKKAAAAAPPPAATT